MKTINCLIIFYFLLFNSIGFFYGQNEKILSSNDQFDYLIGMKYNPFDKLEGLTYMGGGSVSLGNGIELKNMIYSSGAEQIVTSERCEVDPETNVKVCEIRDIIVLNGIYSFCEGCLISNDKNKIIRSIHPYGKRTKDGLLLAYEMNKTTGEFSRVNPSDYKWKSPKRSQNRN